MRGVDELSEAGGSIWKIVIRTPPCPFGASPLINGGGEVTSSERLREGTRPSPTMILSLAYSFRVELFQEAVHKFVPLLSKTFSGGGGHQVLELE